MLPATHLHAMMVHFPIALLLVGFLAEIIAIAFKKQFFNLSAFYLLLLGTLGTIASYLAGNSAGEGIEEGVLGKAIALHEQAATIALWLSVITATVYLFMFVFKYQKIWLKTLRVVLFAGLIGAIATTGYLGGQLVYKHGAGVQLLAPDFSSTGSDADER